MKKEDICPCNSDLYYKTCCKPFHEGALPPTALQLMRSRFSAYALDLPSYIISTTHPKNPHYLEDLALWSKQISQFSKHTQFKNLHILEVREQSEHATVTFFVDLSQGDQDVSFTEKSTFEKVSGKWLYHSGEIKD